MQKIYYVKGYNSFTNRDNSHVFKTQKEANNYASGLTNAKIYMFTGKTIIDAVNHIF